MYWWYTPAETAEEVGCYVLIKKHRTCSRAGGDALVSDRTAPAYRHIHAATSGSSLGPPPVVLESGLIFVLIQQAPLPIGTSLLTLATLFSLLTLKRSSCHCSFLSYEREQSEPADSL